VALLGTLGSLLLTALLRWMFVGLTKLTGFADESAVYLRAVSGDLDVRGLLLAGVVSGSLGVLDDLTVTQVSAVDQIRRVDPALPWRQLHRRGLAVGRDHVASAVNTRWCWPTPARRCLCCCCSRRPSGRSGRC
jgi:uncharacterized membrane protein